METVLEVNKLSKNYGNIQALDGLDLTVKKGTVFGILGPNGSGKTTTLGILLGILKASSGQFQWFQNLSVGDAKKRIGALLETPNFYPYMSGRSNLQLVAKIKGLDNPNIDEVLAQVKLSERAEHKFKTYSLGMKQRLAIAAALLGSPELLVLDEPTNGLDPTGIAEIRQIILEIAEGGTSVIIASHILAEVEKVCSHVAVLQKGKLLYSGRASQLSAEKGLIEMSSADLKRLKEAVLKHPEIDRAEISGELLLAYPETELSPAAINQYLAEQGLFLNHLVFKQASLEERFLKLIDQ